MNPNVNHSALLHPATSLTLWGPGTPSRSFSRIRNYFSERSFPTTPAISRSSVISWSATPPAPMTSDLRWKSNYRLSRNKTGKSCMDVGNMVNSAQHVFTNNFWSSRSQDKWFDSKNMSSNASSKEMGCPGFDSKRQKERRFFDRPMGYFRRFVCFTAGYLLFFKSYSIQVSCYKDQGVLGLSQSVSTPLQLSTPGKNISKGQSSI